MAGNFITKDELNTISEVMNFLNNLSEGGLNVSFDVKITDTNGDSLGMLRTDGDQYALWPVEEDD